MSATIDKKITARYVFENTKYDIALICFLYEHKVEVINYCIHEYILYLYFFC